MLIPENVKRRGRLESEFGLGNWEFGNEGIVLAEIMINKFLKL